MTAVEKLSSNCQTILISFKYLWEALDERFRENGKRFCINFFSYSHPITYLGLRKKKRAIGESSRIPPSVRELLPLPHTITYRTRACRGAASMDSPAAPFPTPQVKHLYIKRPGEFSLEEIKFPEEKIGLVVKLFSLRDFSRQIRGGNTFVKRKCAPRGMWLCLVARALQSW